MGTFQMIGIIIAPIVVFHVHVAAHIQHDPKINKRIKKCRSEKYLSMFIY